MLIGEILTHTAARLPDKVAVIDGDRRLSFSELDRAADRFAGALAAAGLARGARIAILAPNIVEYPVVVFGAARAGVIACMISPRSTAADVAYMLNKTGVELLVFAGDLRPLVDAARGDARALRHLVVIGDGNGEAVPFNAFLGTGSGTPPAVTLAENDPVAMTFTGGTTGFPKAVLVTHRNRVTACAICREQFGLTGEDIGIVAAPLFHAVGQFIWFQTLVMLGCTQVMLPRWDVAAFCDMVERHRATATLMVPTQLRDLLGHPQSSPARLASLRHISYAGAPMALALFDRLTEALPQVEFVEHYGQSETGPLTIRRGSHPHDKRGTVGRAVAGLGLKIVDRDGREVAIGQVGELITRGGHVFTGYWDDPDQTAAAFKNGDGWLWTGDLGVSDDEGFITLVDRSKDMIVSGAENIYPTEIERALSSHPAVAECAVFGIPDDKWGEVPAAHVVLRPGHQATAEDLIAHVVGIVARFKRPRRIEFVERLPKTPVGKVQKSQLRAPYWQGRARQI